ncbi:PLDc N-terminal domain-containing protein [Arthrobacter koreensis]|nr:PLDc N-terminal domain-containing protein [Arthrobacter koreensis]
MLAGAALVDIWRRPGSEIRGPKAAWSAACAVNFIGPISYFVFGRRRG